MGTIRIFNDSLGCKIVRQLPYCCWKLEIIAPRLKKLSECCIALTLNVSNPRCMVSWLTQSMHLQLSLGTVSMRGPGPTSPVVASVVASDYTRASPQNIPEPYTRTINVSMPSKSFPSRILRALSLVSRPLSIVLTRTLA
jgi:hypothetical protein